MNQLEKSTSPYLRLFASSPVDWREYDVALLKEARTAQKTLHISIGRFLSTRTRHEQRFYSRKEVAQTLNDACINVKIDADERPDLERYFTANFEPKHRQGASALFEIYPTTLFIEPDRLELSVPSYLFCYDPYDDGTPRHHPPQARELLTHLLVHASIERGSGSMLISEAHRRGRLQIEPKPLRQYTRCLDEARHLRSKLIAVDVDGEIATARCIQSVAMFLMRLWFLSLDRSRDDVKGLDIALIGLTRWVRNESFDHIEGGFFPPMRLRDPMGADIQKSLAFNAWSLDLLMQAVSISHDSLLAQSARETADYLVGDLLESKGGFIAGWCDANTTTRLAWDRRTVRRALSEDEYLVIETLYGLDKKANWYGRWLPRRMGSWRSVVDQLFFSNEETEKLLASARAKLRKLAQTRDLEIERDGRTFTAANCTAISALLLAGVQMKKSRWRDAAVNALQWVLTQRLTDGGLVTATGTHVGVTAVDYALLLKAALDCLAYRWDPVVAAKVPEIFDALKARHWTGEALLLSEMDRDGALLTLPKNHEIGCVHPVDALRRGLHLYATLFQNQHAFLMLKWLFEHVEAYAASFEMDYNPSSDFTLDFLRGECIAILRGPEDACEHWRAELSNTYKPFRHVFVIPYADAREAPSYLPRMMSLEDRERVSAFLLRDQLQLEPIYDLEEARAAFEEL